MSKYNLLNSVKNIHNCKILEIGVAEGNTLKSLLEINNTLEYTGVDPWIWSIELTRPPHGLKQLKSQDDIDGWYHKVLDIIKPFSNRAKVIRGFSKNIIPTLSEKFDVIHIDGDHTYDGCKWDLDNTLPLLKDGGTIVVDDVRTWDGVTQAWKEFKEQYPHIKVLP